MEFYLTDLSEPISYIGRALAEHFHTKVNSGKEPLLYGGMLDREIFRQFRDSFNCVSITAGLPRNDYGQTVRLFLVEEKRNIAEYEWKEIPPHLIGEGLSLKPNEVTGRYGYKKVEDNRGKSLAVDEYFFFEFQLGYAPDTFSKFKSSLKALRYCSEIVHCLDRFEVTLMHAGVHVCLRARIADTYKPPFLMNC